MSSRLRATSTGPSPISTRRSKWTPNDAGSYNNRGAAYKAKGQNERAVADFGKALEINPGLRRFTTTVQPSTERKAKLIERSPIIPRQSRSIRYTATPTLVAAVPSRPRATTFVRLRISLRLSRSSRRVPTPSIIAAWLTVRRGRSMRRSRITPTRLS